MNAPLLPIFDHLWQSTVFAAAARLLTLALRKNRARVRHGLWLAASMQDTGEKGPVAANLRDTVQDPKSPYQATFLLKQPGSYVCRVLVREQATGLMYTEAIQFDLK